MADDGTVVNSSSDIYRVAPTVTVYTRDRWADDWEEQPRMYCARIRWGCSPEGSAGTFVVDCGAVHTIERPGQFQHLEALDVLGHYVKVKIQRATLDVDGQSVVPDPIYWYGVVTEDSKLRDGAKRYHLADSDETVRVLTLTQTLQAVGLESLFDKVPLDRIYTMSQSGGAEVVQVFLAIPFNAPHTFKGDGNRSTTVATDTGVYVFTDALSTAAAWSTRNIVEYAVKYFQPVDWLGLSHIPCSLTVAALATLPTWDKPLVAYEAKTLRDLLNELCDRRRNMAWQVLVDEDVAEGESHELKIDVFSFNSSPITLPSGAEQAENFDPVQIDFDSAIDVRASLTASIRHKVDQVIVRGARKRSCFSLSYADGTLVSDWPSTKELAYKNGPASLPGTSAEQQRAVIEYRRQDDLQQVYAYFKVPDDWDFMVGDDGADSSGSSGSEGALPIDPCMDDATASTMDWGYLPSVRFLNELFPEMQDAAPEASAQEAPSPFAVIEIEDGTYRLVDQLAETAGLLDRGAGKGRTWSVSIRMRADCPGIIARVSGAQQLVLAATDFPASSTTAYELEPQLDYRDMIVTVACETFGYVTAEWPTIVTVAGLSVDQATKVHVDIGDAGRLDWVVKNTVTGIDNGSLQRQSEGEYVRDDRDWMEDLARYVYEWYGVARQAFQFSMEQILDLLKVGQLITKIGSGTLEESVNSVVVAVTFDFVTQQTLVDTSFSNLDIDTVASWFGNDSRAKARRQS